MRESRRVVIEVYIMAAMDKFSPVEKRVLHGASEIIAHIIYNGLVMLVDQLNGRKLTIL